MSSTLSSESLKESIEQCFGDITDTRVIGKTAHKLVDIIAISLLAVICGADGWVGIGVCIAMESATRLVQNQLDGFLALATIHIWINKILLVG